jgi:hypothetical protein
MNFVEYVQLDDGTCLACNSLNHAQIKNDQIIFANYYNSNNHSLNLSHLEITTTLLDAIFEDLSCFINKNKVESLLLDSNKFVEDDFDNVSDKAGQLLENCQTFKFVEDDFDNVSDKAGQLLENCQTLELVSLENNFEYMPKLNYQWRLKFD